MTDLELIFSMLGEAASTEITRNRNAQGFEPNRQAARDGGDVAGHARRELEAKSGKRVITSANHLPSKETRQLPSARDETSKQEASPSR